MDCARMIAPLCVGVAVALPSLGDMLITNKKYDSEIIKMLFCQSKSNSNHQKLCELTRK